VELKLTDIDRSALPVSIKDKKNKRHRNSTTIKVKIEKED